MPDDYSYIRSQLEKLRNGQELHAERLSSVETILKSHDEWERKKTLDIENVSKRIDALERNQANQEAVAKALDKIARRVTMIVGAASAGIVALVALLTYLHI